EGRIKRTGFDAVQVAFVAVADQKMAIAIERERINDIVSAGPEAFGGAVTRNHIDIRAARNGGGGSWSRCGGWGDLDFRLDGDRRSSGRADRKRGGWSGQRRDRPHRCGRGAAANGGGVDLILTADGKRGDFALRHLINNEA